MGVCGNYRRLAERLDEIVFITDLNGRMLFANAALERLTGFRADDFWFEQPDNPFLHRDDAARVGKFIADFVASGDDVSETIENRFCDRWGRILSFRSVLARITFDSTPALQFITRPLSDSLREAPGDVLRDYRVLVENAGDGIVKLDRDGRFLFANRRFQELAAKDAIALGRAKIADLLAPASAELAKRFQTSGCFEATLRGNGESTIDVEVVATSIGESGDMLAMIRDVTEKRRLEQELSNREKLDGIGLLAGGIAHDMNNIVGVVTLNASLAERASERGDDPSAFLQEIQRASGQAKSLCLGLLRAAGRAQISHARVDLKALAMDTVSLLRATISPAVTLSFVAGDRPVLVDCDAGALQSAIMNLVVNANEALGDRQGTIVVEVGEGALDAPSALRFDGGALDAEASAPFVRVRDDGGGMDGATRARMFDPFFTTKAAGHGLGLSSVLGTVRMHHGAIDVRTAPGAGTSMTIHLPRRSDADVQEPTPPAPAARAAANVILIADDEPALRRAIALTLEGNGFATLVADDGAQALDAVRAHEGKLAAVLLDSNMPRMSGVEAAREIERIRPTLPIVLMTGFVGPQLAGEGRELLEKPFDMATLVETVKRVVRRHASR
jgi:PAS domain S-box-containing protein